MNLGLKRKNVHTLNLVILISQIGPTLQKLGLFIYSQSNFGQSNDNSRPQGIFSAPKSTIRLYFKSRKRHLIIGFYKILIARS